MKVVFFFFRWQIVVASAIFLVFSILAPAPGNAGATRGISVKAKTKQGAAKNIALYSGYHALIIGCGDYSKGWPYLPNPVADAREISVALKKLGFKVDLVENPDGARLRNSLNRLIGGSGKDKEKGILIWYSGHGHTLAEADGSKLGYLVPINAPNPDRDEIGFMNTAVSMRDIETVARRIHSKHVLMIFDSCFSGSVFETTRALPSPYIMEIVAEPVRQFITAGTENEEVPDRSIFKDVFLSGIQKGHADTNSDSYVTGQELGAYLQEHVVNYTNKNQHPQYGKINSPKLDKGDFVFVLEKQRPDSYPAKGYTSTPSTSQSQALAQERANLDQERRELEEMRNLMEERKQLDAERSRLEAEKKQQAVNPPVTSQPATRPVERMTNVNRNETDMEQFGRFLGNIFKNVKKNNTQRR